jgi:hypothetical protein
MKASNRFSLYGKPGLDKATLRIQGALEAHVKAPSQLTSAALGAAILAAEKLGSTDTASREQILYEYDKLRGNNNSTSDDFYGWIDDAEKKRRKTTTPCPTCGQMMPGER